MALIDITPIMTSNTTPSPYVVSASSEFNAGYKAWNAFDNTVNDSTSDGWVSSASPNQWLKIDFNKSTVINSYEITNRGYAGDVKIPKSWILQGSNDDLTWKDLDTRTNEFVEQTPMSKKMFKCGRHAYRYYRLYINEYHNPSSYISIGQLRFFVETGSDRKNSFKSPVCVDGYIELRDTGLVPENPVNGDLKLFVKDGKLFQLDNNGTQSEVGSGSSISGKVVTGIESGQDKIVISFSDGTQEEVAVVTDLTEINEEIQKTKSEVSSLKVRSHAGEELDYGYFKNKNDISLSNGTVIPFDDRINGSIECVDGKIYLEDGKTYKIGCGFVVVGKDNTPVYLKAIDSKGNELAINSMYPVTNSTHVSPMNNMEFIHTATDGDYIYIDTRITQSVSVDLRSQYTYLVIEEMGRAYYHNEVKSVDEKDGIQDSPVGHIMTHVGVNPPKHYLVCNGNEYNISDYPKLAEHILNEFGSYNYFGGDGVTTFSVPYRRKSENDITPIMTSDTTPAPYVITTSGITSGQDAWKAFNGSVSSPSDCWASDKANGWIQIDFGKKVAITSFALTGIMTNTQYNPKSFKVYGSNDNSTFDLIYEATNQVGWRSMEVRKYNLQDVANYRYFRLETFESNGASYSAISLINFFEQNDEIICIKYEPTYYMEYHPKYATFKTDVLFEGEITDLGEYTLANSIYDYDYIEVYGNLLSAGSVDYYKTFTKIRPSDVKGNSAEFAITYLVNVKVTSTTPRFGFTFEKDNTLNVTYKELGEGTTKGIKITHVIGVKGGADLPDIPNTGDSMTSEEAKDMIEDIWNGIALL